ncbi:MULTISPECIES: hypothetical protein [Sphingobacterium]|uniref:Uncharacterized protein n=2 Tax=Sphingobacterium TaxID=28453 RepID=U2J803_9SPHI|nr:MULTISPECIES: hypothetical protein [Sphingobacterium]ERJ58788.1 hypothetical protein M472_08405 [Sphingobacterium paucimobilis HER1398]MBL1411007.1 hypothetical protein [Sphingobacterium faecale]
MEQLIKVLIQHDKKRLKLTKKQNQLIGKLISLSTPTDKEMLKKMIIDNADLKEIFKVADTKFYRLKKLFTSYELDAKDYYLTEEILKTIKKYKRKPETESSI